MDKEEQQETPLAAVNKLLICTFLMFSAPFITYFVSKKYIFEEMMGYPAEMSTLLAVIPAVMMVNLIIALYVYLAWNSEPFKDCHQSSTENSKEETTAKIENESSYKSINPSLQDSLSAKKTH